MLKQNIIETSKSLYCFIIVPKKSDASGQEKFCLVAGFRKLNELTLADVYPLPNISEIFELGRSRYVTTLNLKLGFYKIEMDTKNAEKTTFSTLFNHQLIKQMPMSLKGASATFFKG